MFVHVHFRNFVYMSFLFFDAKICGCDDRTIVALSALESAVLLPMDVGSCSKDIRAPLAVGRDSFPLPTLSVR